MDEHTPQPGPGLGPDADPIGPAGYHYVDEASESRGPVSFDELAALARAGRIDADTLVWTPGWADWQPARVVPGVAFAPPTQPGPIVRHRCGPTDSPRRPWGGPERPAPAYDPTSFPRLFWWYVVLRGLGVVFYAVAVALPIVVMVMTANAPNDELRVAAQGASYLLYFLVAVGPPIPAWILIYRSWSMIQDGHAETTPGKGVGFLFIPFFNYYWEFVAVWGLARDLGWYGQRHGVGPIAVKPGFALAAVIVTTATEVLGCCLGLFGLPLVLVAIVLKCVAYWQIARSAAVVASTPRGSAPYCQRCGYNLAGLPANAYCPECGERPGRSA